MLFFGCVECWAAAVVGCRLTAFQSFKRRIYSSYFVLDSYPAPSPKPNPYFACIYICTVIKTGSRKFPKPYSLQRRKFQLLLFFSIIFCRNGHVLSNRAHWRISSLHYLIPPAVIVAINARSWAWSISQDTQIMSPSTANKSTPISVRNNKI